MKIKAEGSLRNCTYNVQENKTVSSFKEGSSLKTVTLYVNPLSEEEGSFYGRVTRNTITLENIIASIIKTHVGIEPFMIQHVVNLITDKVADCIRQGNSVDLIGAGTLYIKVDGCIKGENPSTTSVKGFKLGFTPSALIQQAVDDLKIDVVTIKDTNPQIDTIINTYDKNTDKVLDCGKTVRLTGQRLKISGADSGIFFAPVVKDTETGEQSLEKDESKWTKVEENTISVNLPKTLEFYVPEELDREKQYSIVLRTRATKGGSAELKTLICTQSPAVTIKGSAHSSD